MVWKNPEARYLLILKTISGIPIGVLHSMFGMITMHHFKLSAEVNGYVLSYIGIVSMVGIIQYTQYLNCKILHGGTLLQP